MEFRKIDDRTWSIPYFVVVRKRKRPRAKADPMVRAGKASLKRYCNEIGATWTLEKEDHELEITFADGRKLQTYFNIDALDYQGAVNTAELFLETAEPDPHNFEEIAPGVWYSLNIW